MPPIGQGNAPAGCSVVKVNGVSIRTDRLSARKHDVVYVAVALMLGLELSGIRVPGTSKILQCGVRLRDSLRSVHDGLRLVGPTVGTLDLRMASGNEIGGFWALCSGN